MILDFLKANPGLAITGGLLLAGMLVSLLFVVILRQAGQSLRPIAFFLGFFLIVVLPQFLFHLSQAKAPQPGQQPQASFSTPASGDTPSGWEEAWAHDQGRFLHPNHLFGPKAEAPLIRDARTIFPDFLGQAQAAQMAFFPSGNTLLAARFADMDGATAALRGYLAQFQVGMAGGDLVQGLVVPRGSVGDMARIRLTGPLLMVWTAADPAALASFTDGWSPTATPAAPASAATDKVYIDPLIKKPAMWLFLLANMALAVVFFFKGAVWATRTPAPEHVAPLPQATLVNRLLAINNLDVPMTVSSSPDGRSLVVDWRFADARWLDLARAHMLRRQHRLVLDFDEAHHTVRVREYWRDLEASLGADGARASWQMGRGITFYQHEHQRVFGLQFDSAGRPLPQLSYAYTFNLQELRQPFQQAVTQAGWTWQPVLVDAPASLRWLTE
ncbi:MAG: hypothetical protein AB1421_14290 [Pseudomonadota bacterium]